MYKVSYKYENELEGLEIESDEELIEVFPYLLQTEKGNILLTKQEGFDELFDVNIAISPLPGSMRQPYQIKSAVINTSAMTAKETTPISGGV